MRQAITTLLLGLSCLMGACATVPPPPPEPKPDPNMVSLLEYEKKTRALLEATERLYISQNDLDEQRRRLSNICVDYPDHDACSPFSDVNYARDAFCSDEEFTEHVDTIVQACHQGQCKQVDQAELLTRTQYMMLVQRLPHSLVLFKAHRTGLGRTTKKQLQQFMENVQADKGYVIIVGRASKDGPWRKNLEYALGRAENTRAFLVDELGLDAKRVGYITYGHSKMYLTSLDAERLSKKRLTQTEANRSAFVFTYPCYE